MHALTGPLWLARMWWLSATASVIAAPMLIACMPNWHDARGYVAQLALVQTWISIAACVGLLVISKRKHTQTQEAWAQGAVLIFVLGGLLTAIMLNYGVLPQWLVHPSAMAKLAQVVALALLHWNCAWCVWRHMGRCARPKPAAPASETAA